MMLIYPVSIKGRITSPADQMDEKGQKEIDALLSSCFFGVEKDMVIRTNLTLPIQSK
jgi:hypothetical protein